MIPSILRDIAAAFMLLTRVPVPWARISDDPPDLARAMWAYPVVGTFVGSIGALILWLAYVLGLSNWIASGFALLALVLATGAFHEDGLADVADGFWGGSSKEAKLEIMRDSRIGTYGTVALVLAFGLRWAALASLSPLAGAMAMVAVGSLSRAMIVPVPMLLSPARSEGMGQASGKPTVLHCVAAIGIGALVTLTLLGSSTMIPVVLASGAGMGIIVMIAWRQIGGYTGDVLGATQQLTEIAALMAIVSLTGQTT